jgi:hypothetical protein
MLDRENNKVYIKYRKSSWAESTAVILYTGAAGIGIVRRYFEKGAQNELADIFFKSGLTLVILGAALFIGFIIFMVNTLFSSDINFFIDLNRRKLVLIQGKRPFKSEINLDFGEIREIVLVRTKFTVKKYKSEYKYIIDIYDRQLNAYECYDETDFDIIQNTANEIGRIFNVGVLDKTDTDDYEGFIKRVV